MLACKNQHWNILKTQDLKFKQDHLNFFLLFKNAASPSVPTFWSASHLGKDILNIRITLYHFQLNIIQWKVSLIWKLVLLIYRNTEKCLGVPLAVLRKGYLITSSFTTFFILLTQFWLSSNCIILKACP